MPRPKTIEWTLPVHGAEVILTEIFCKINMTLGLKNEHFNRDAVAVTAVASQSERPDLQTRLLLLSQRDDSQAVAPIFIEGDELMFKKLFPKTVIYPEPVKIFATPKEDMLEIVGLPKTASIFS